MSSNKDENSSGSGSDGEDYEEPNLAAQRDKRSTAGTKMARLLEAEDEDDFYKTTYGGFNEEEDDCEYASEESEADDVDSDFDIDETEVVVDTEEDVDRPKRRKRGAVTTKAYKEPAKKQPKMAPPALKKPKPVQTSASLQTIGKKSLRRTTENKSQQLVEREKDREHRMKMMKDIAARKNVTEVRRLTQDELLAEALITEQQNMKSLEEYTRLELEKKRSRVTKQVYRGPVIRYNSTTMPLIEQLPSNEPEINVDALSPTEPIKEIPFSTEQTTEQTQPGQTEKTKLPPTTAKCSRTFITFTDDKTFAEVFHHKKSRPPPRQYCPVTRLPAKYFDPITLTPYATAQAFKAIRDTYWQHVKSQNEKKTKQKQSSQPASPVTAAVS
ncbi:vacuolar protein sorting-associated protein 72 homolog isoform X2 [Tubulanus polymorphus]